MTGYRDIKLVSETWLVAGQAFPEYSSPPPPAYQLHLVDTADESNHPEMVLKLESPDIWGRRKSSFYALLSGKSMLYNKNPLEGYCSLPQPEDMITTLISSTDTESNEVVYSVSMLISKLLEFGNSPSRRRTIEWTEWKRYAIPMEGFGTRCCFCVNFSMSGWCETSAQDFGSDFSRGRSRVRGAVPQRLAREESRIGSLFHCRLLYKMSRLIYFIYRSVLMSYVG